MIWGFVSDSLFKQNQASCLIIRALIKQSHMKKKAKMDFLKLLM